MEVNAHNKYCRKLKNNRFKMRHAAYSNRSTQANIILNIVIIKMSLTKNCKELSFQTNNITNKEVVL